VSGFLLDTNVLSEIIKKTPDTKVASWLEDGLDEDILFMSVLTIGEIRKGACVLPNASRRAAIEAWLEKDLKVRFSGRILPISEAIADRWGILSGHARMNKTVLPVIDGLMAATALDHNLIFVTRNVKDISSTGVTWFNPWEAS